MDYFTTFAMRRFKVDEEMPRETGLTFNEIYQHARLNIGVDHVKPRNKAALIETQSLPFLNLAICPSTFRPTYATKTIKAKYQSNASCSALEFLNRTIF